MTERFAVVDAELRRAEAYVTRLRDELNDKAPGTAKDGSAIMCMQTVVDTIQGLRFHLGREQSLP